MNNLNGNTLIYLAITALFFSCSNPPTYKPATVKNDSAHVTGFYMDSAKVTSDYKEYKGYNDKPEITIANPTDYSEKFISRLEGLNGYKSFKLQDSMLIIDNRDTAYFPKETKIGKYIVLTGKKGEIAVALSLTRINYTTIDYKIEMSEFGKASHTQVGQADIIESFFLGSEMDVSDQSGLGYAATEYTDNRENNCNTSIRLGYEKETGPYLLGHLIKNCNGRLGEVTLDNFPMLHEK